MEGRITKFTFEILFLQDSMYWSCNFFRQLLRSKEVWRRKKCWNSSFRRSIWTRGMVRERGWLGGGTHLRW
jgi:hypothetical protein